MEIKSDAPWDKESEIEVSFPDEDINMILIYYEDGAICVEHENDIDWHDWR